MKVRVVMVDGMVLDIDEPWFVEHVASPTCDWRDLTVVRGVDRAGWECLLNPNFIIRLWFVDSIRPDMDVQ